MRKNKEKCKISCEAREEDCEVNLSCVTFPSQLAVCGIQYINDDVLFLCHLAGSHHDLLAIEDIDAGVSGSGGAEGDALEGVPLVFCH